jgi:hypothetical protein
MGGILTGLAGACKEKMQFRLFFVTVEYIIKNPSGKEQSHDH